MIGILTLLHGMGLMLQVTWQLMNLCIIAIVVIPGSSGNFLISNVQVFSFF